MPDPITRLNAALEGRYRIESELGEGGMATVYLADDLKHERNVALKVLKPELAAVVGAERFLAEIKTTANLQHPHILPLFDSGEADTYLFYVMPYVEGETLRDRLDREHQLPVDDAVQIAKNVAEALDYAHRQGVIHRDIKPANILLQDGKPVISDFGIALAVGVAGGGRLTETGLSLGTPHYMSPEQATGDLSVGAATDVYALGCVLYEMLVGEPPFTGSTPQAVLGKIILGEVPSAKAERASVPPNVDAVIAKALEKVPADRFTTARAFRSALENPAFRARAENRAASPAWRPVTAVVTTGGWVLAAAALGLWLLPRNDVDNPSGSRSTLHASFALPDSAPLAVNSWGRQLVLSPDGSTLVYVAQRGSVTQLYKRALDDSLVTAIPGTEGAFEPFFSPDGEWVGFRHDLDRVSKVPTAGGPVEAVGSGLFGRGATWIPGAIVANSEDGRELILFPDGGGAADTLRPQSGLGNLATLPDPAWVLGRLGDNRAGVVEVETGAVFLLTPQGPRPYVFADESGGLRGTSFQYLPSGHIVFLRLDGVVAAAPFDAASLTVTGSEQSVLQGVRASPFTGSEQLAVGPSGTLVYARGAFAMDGQPSFIDEQGALEELQVERRFYGAVALSPDGRRIAADVYPAVGPKELWVLDLDSGREAALNIGWTGAFSWWPDGESLVYFETVAGEAGDRRGRLIRHYLRDMVSRDTLDFIASPTDVSRDARWFLGGGLLYDLEADTAARVRPTGGMSRLSPDGDWITWTRLQGDQFQIFVAPFDEGRIGLEELVGPGFSPAWAHDAGRLYWYEPFEPIRLMFAEPPDFVPQELMVIPHFMSRTGRDIDVAPDGRILYVPTSEQAPISRLTVVTNWAASLPVAGG